MRNYWIIIFSAGLLSACGQSPVDSVKSSYLDEERTITAAQLLENREICDDTEWTDFEDDRGRTIVEYNCILDGADDFFDKKREEYKLKEEDSLSYQIPRYEEGIKTANSNIKSINSHSEDKTVQKKIDEIMQDGYYDDDIRSPLKLINQKAHSLINQYDEESLIELVLSDEMLALESHLSSFYYPYHTHLYSLIPLHGSGEFKNNIRKMQALPSKLEQENYKKEFLIKYINNYREALPKLETATRKVLQSQIDIFEKRQLEEITQTKKEFENERVSRESNVNYQLATIKDYEIKLNNARERLDNLDQVVMTEVPEYEDLIERFLWVVNEEGESTLTYGEIVAIASDEEDNKIIIKHTRPYQALSVINNQKPTALLADYLGSLQVSGWMNFIYGN